MRCFRIPMAAAVSLSLALGAPQARAQGFFPDDPPAPDIGLTVEQPGFGQPGPVTAPGTSPALSGTLGLGLLLGLAAAAGGGGGGGGTPGERTWTGSVLDGCRAAADGRAAFETDEYFGNVGLGMICAADRYLAGSFGAGVTVAVFDDGFDQSHPDLDANIAAVLDLYERAPDFRIDGDHGTHVAGIIAAERNGSGMHGVAPLARIVGIRGLSDMPDNPSVADDPTVLSNAVSWAGSQGARVMNHSWSLSDITITDVDGMQDLTDLLGAVAVQSLQSSVQAGMVHVFAAMNDGADQPSVFAGLPFYAPQTYDDRVIVVVSVDPDGRVSDFSNRCGIALDHCIAAPGGYIRSTVSGGGYALYDGTSMAAPMVSGAIALLLGEFPELTAAQAVAILKDTATDTGIHADALTYGHGLLNLSGAMQPVGAVAIELAATVGADARPVADSGIAAHGALARSLAATLRGQRMVVTDGFARGFAVDAGRFVAEVDDSAALLDRAWDFATSEGLILRQADAAGEVRFSPWGAEALAPPGPLGDVHAPQVALLDGSAAMAWTAALGGGLTGTLEVAGPAASAGTGATAARYLGGRLAVPLGRGAEITLGAGLLREAGGFLGADLEGGFGNEVVAETALLSLGAAVDLGGAALRVSYTDGTTGFTGDGALQAGRDVGTRSIGLSWERAGPRGGRFGLGVRRALDVTGGTVDVMLPVARAPSGSAAPSTGVVMASAALPLDPVAAPTDLELRYSLPVGRGQLGLAVTHRLDDDTTVAGLGYRIRF